MSKKFLNLGCGDKFVPGWTNVDLVSTSKFVDKINFLNGLPYPDSSFDLIYSAQVLEHFSENDGEGLLMECWRVLKPNAIFRVVVPDLENIVINYLSCLNSVLDSPTASNDLKYRWSLIELLDQLVRTKSGGMMKDFLIELDNTEAEKYVVQRCGNVVESIIANRVPQKRRITLNKIFYKLRDFANGLVRPNRLICDTFHSSGELHKWMYDFYSLKSALLKAGFKNVSRMSPTKTNITDWSEYELDFRNGSAIDPLSLFVECKK